MSVTAALNALFDKLNALVCVCRSACYNFDGWCDRSILIGNYYLKMDTI